MSSGIANDDSLFTAGGDQCPQTNVARPLLSVCLLPAANQKQHLPPRGRRAVLRTRWVMMAWNSGDITAQMHEWRFRPEPLSVFLFLLKIRLLHSVWDWVPWLRVSRRGRRQVPGGARLHLARYLLRLCRKWNYHSQRGDEYLFRKFMLG